MTVVVNDCFVANFFDLEPWARRAERPEAYSDPEDSIDLCQDGQ